VEAKATDLADAARLIERQVAAPGARFAIADEGCPDESSLMGTRDGLLNLALAVVRLVAAADAGRGWEDGGRFAWGDGVKAAMHQLPSAGAVWLVGAYLFRDHAAFMAELGRWAGPEAASLAADPDFREPPRGQAPDAEPSAAADRGRVS